MSIDFKKARAIKESRDILVPEVYMYCRNNGITLTEYLEQHDPSNEALSSRNENEPLLDAFERQLILHNIVTTGPKASEFQLFFQSTSSSVLFPEWVRRVIRSGKLLQPILQHIVGTTTYTTAQEYTTLYFAEETEERQLYKVAEGAELPEINIKTAEHSLKPYKYGCFIKASYESLRRKSLNVIKVLLERIAAQTELDKVATVINTIINGDGDNNPARIINTNVSGVISYEDLISLWGELYPYQMTTIISNKANHLTILNFDEFKKSEVGRGFEETGEVTTPIGARLIRHESIGPDYIIGLDKRFAIEEIIESELTVETDRLIRGQFETTAVSETIAFGKIFNESAIILNKTW